MRTLHLTDCTIDFERGEIRRGADRWSLTPNEASVLRYLADRAGTLVDAASLEREVLGISARVDSRALSICVRRLRAKLEATPDAPRHLFTVRGRGYRLDVPAGAAPPSPELAGLVGRAGALAALDRLHDAGRRWVSVVGPGGIGKTRLVAGWIEPRADLPAAWVRLAGMDRDVALAAIALALATGGPHPTDAIGLALAERPRRVVLDDAPPSLAPDVARWVARAPRASVVVTALAPLHGDGETVYPLDALDTEAGVAVLRARGARPSAGLDGLVEALGGVPLALELAAPLLEVLEPSELSGRGVGLERVLERTWAALEPAGQAALVACAVLPSPFPVAAAEAAIGPGAVDALVELRQRALLHRTDAGLRVLEPVRRFVATRGDPRGAADRYAAWAVGRVEPQVGAEVASLDAAAVLREHAPLFTAGVPCGDPVWAARFARCRVATLGDALSPDARAAMLAAVDVPALPPPLARAVAIDRAWAALHGSRPGEASALLDRAGTDVPAVADRVWLGRAVLAHRSGDLTGAEDAARRVRPGSADALRARMVVGDVLLARRRLDDAAAHVSTVLADLDAAGAWVQAGQSAISLSAIELARRRFDRAEALLARALDASDRAGTHRASATVVSNLAQVALERGRPDEARAHGERALAMARAFGSAPLEALAVGRLGLAHLLADRPELAEPALVHASEQLEQLGRGRDAAAFRTCLGYALWCTGDLDRAETAFRSSLEAAPDVDRTDERFGLALVALDRGRPDDARRYLDGCDPAHPAVRTAPVHFALASRAEPPPIEPWDRGGLDGFLADALVRAALRRAR